jgi:hypothetical protein
MPQGGIDPRSVLPYTPEQAAFVSSPEAAYSFQMTSLVAALLAENRFLVQEHTSVTRDLIAAFRDNEQARISEANRATQSSERFMGRFVELNSERFKAEADRDVKIAERDREYARIHRDRAEAERKEADKIAAQAGKEVAQLREQLREAESVGDDEGAAMLRQQLAQATMGVVGAVIDYFTRDKEAQDKAPRRGQEEGDDEPEPPRPPPRKPRSPPGSGGGNGMATDIPGAPRPKVRPVTGNGTGNGGGTGNGAKGMTPEAAADVLASMTPEQRRAAARRLAGADPSLAAEFSMGLVDAVDKAGGLG